METISEYAKLCPAADSETVLREVWEVENGCGCAIGAELLDRSCGREKACSEKGKEGCLLR